MNFNEFPVLDICKIIEENGFGEDGKLSEETKKKILSSPESSFAKSILSAVIGSDEGFFRTFATILQAEGDKDVKRYTAKIKQFTCPLSKQIMRTPVTLRRNRLRYDKKSLVHHLKTEKTDPQTGEKLEEQADFQIDEAFDSQVILDNWMEEFKSKGNHLIECCIAFVKIDPIGKGVMGGSVASTIENLFDLFKFVCPTRELFEKLKKYYSTVGKNDEKCFEAITSIFEMMANDPESSITDLLTYFREHIENFNEEYATSETKKEFLELVLSKTAATSGELMMQVKTMKEQGRNEEALEIFKKRFSSLPIGEESADDNVALMEMYLGLLEEVGNDTDISTVLEEGGILDRSSAEEKFKIFGMALRYHPKNDSILEKYIDSFIAISNDRENFEKLIEEKNITMQGLMFFTLKLMQKQKTRSGGDGPDVVSRRLFNGVVERCEVLEQENENLKNKFEEFERDNRTMKKNHVKYKIEFAKKLTAVRGQSSKNQKQIEILLSKYKALDKKLHESQRNKSMEQPREEVVSREQPTVPKVLQRDNRKKKKKKPKYEPKTKSERFYNDDEDTPPYQPREPKEKPYQKQGLGNNYDFQNDGYDGGYNDDIRETLFDNVESDDHGEEGVVQEKLEEMEGKLEGVPIEDLVKEISFKIVSDMVMVRNLPCDIQEHQLRDFFQSHLSGVGRITKIEVEDEDSSYITLNNIESVRKILAMDGYIINDAPVDIFPMLPDDMDERYNERGKVFIEGLRKEDLENTPKLKAELLKFGLIFEIFLSPNKKRVTVTFVNRIAQARCCELDGKMMMGSKVTVKKVE